MKIKIGKIIAAVTISGTLLFNPFSFIQIVSPAFAQTASPSPTDQSANSSPAPSNQPTSSDTDASVPVQPPQVTLTPDAQGANNLSTRPCYLIHHFTF